MNNPCLFADTAQGSVSEKAGVGVISNLLFSGINAGAME